MSRSFTTFKKLTMLFLPIKQNLIKAVTYSLCMVLCSTYKNFKRKIKCYVTFPLWAQACYDFISVMFTVSVVHKLKLKTIIFIFLD